MVLSNDICADDRGRSQVRVQVQWKDGQMTEFTQELANLYQPAEGTPDAERLARLRQAANLKHAAKIPKVQLQLFAGCTVALRTDPTVPGGLAIDEAALQASSVDEYIAEQRRQQARASAKNAAVPTGPPWDVPAHCPNCGAPVDQATAAKEQDPHCRFCEQPIPVTPRGRR